MMLAPWYPTRRAQWRCSTIWTASIRPSSLKWNCPTLKAFFRFLISRWRLATTGEWNENCSAKRRTKDWRWTTLRTIRAIPRTPSQGTKFNAQSVARPRNTNNLQSPSYAQSYRKTITRKAHSNHLGPRRTSHHVLSSSHLCIFQYLSCGTNLTMVCNVFLISTRLMRVCVTLVAELSSRPRPGRAHPRPSPARVENAAHPKSATRSNVVYQATCMLCDSSYIGMTTRALHTRALEHIAGARKYSLKSAFGEHYKNKHPKMAPSLNMRLLDQCRDELRLHIEEALAIQRHRPQLNRRDEDMGTGFLIWSALCCLSRSRSFSRYLCADNVAIYLHFSVQLIGFYLSFSWTLLSFFPFFVSSFDPLAPHSRFHLNLAKAFLASLYMRTTIFLSSCMVS